jgi:hypothetical protein
MRPEEMDELIATIVATPIATVITDPHHHDNPIVAVNRAFEMLTGYEEAEVKGRNCRLLAGPGTEPEWQAVLRRAVAEGRPALTELTNYKKDGTPFRNAVMIAPVLDEAGRVALFIGSQMDVGGQSPLAGTQRARAIEQVAALTTRQRQVLDHMIRGYRNKQIAGFLGIDEKTVKMHRAGLLTRLGAASSAEAIRIGVEAGLSDHG